MPSDVGSGFASGLRGSDWANLKRVTLPHHLETSSPKLAFVRFGALVRLGVIFWHYLLVAVLHACSVLGDRPNHNPVVPVTITQW